MVAPAAATTTKEPRAVVAVAASAGGVEALTALVRSLPADFPGAVLVVLHVPETGPSVLPSILARAGRLRVVAGHQGIQLEEGLVVVAPPGQHLRVDDGVATVDHGPRENGHRPSADVLFRSVAERFGAHCAGVVLSGTMDDGASGLRVIGERGGLTVVQDPAEATFPGMPVAAIAKAPPDVVCAVDRMGDELARWAAALSPVEVDDPPVAPPTQVEPLPLDDPPAPDGPVELTDFTCPECGGSLWTDPSMGPERFRCRVGHSFSTGTLVLGKQDAVEAALWAAIVALEERADLSRRMLRRLEGVGRRSRLQRYRDDIDQSAGRIELLKTLIGDLGQELLPTPTGMEDGPDDHGHHTTD